MLPCIYIKVHIHILYILHTHTHTHTHTRGFPGGSVVKNLSNNTKDMGDVGSIPGSGKSSGEGNGNVVKYLYLIKSLRGA